MAQVLLLEKSVNLSSNDFHLQMNSPQSKKNITNDHHHHVIYKLPPQCTPLTHQAAGHFFGSGKRG
jgi:hypothetical protein